MVYKHIIRGRYTSLLQHGSRHPTKRYNGTFRSSYVSPSKTDDDTEAPHYHRERLIRDDTSSSSTTVKKYDLLSQGCIPYSRSWAYQQVLLNYRLEQRRTMQQASSSPRDRDCVMMLEVSPVYTLGRGADEAHLTFLNNNSSDNNAHYFASAISEKLSRTVRGPGTARLSLDRHTEEKLRTAIRNAEYNIDTATETFVIVEGLAAEISPVVAPNGVPIYRVERGGEVTFHGPSQLVVYPMFDLKHGNNLFKEDLHWYLRRIEEVIIQTLQCYGIEGNRDNINTGVWVGESKIAAVGISSSRWITTHGFALNVDPDLSCFDTSIILPCGIEDRGVTSMGKILRDRNEVRVPSIREVSAVVTEAMEDVFGILIVEE